MGPTNRETSEFLQKFSNKLCEKNGFNEKGNSVNYLAIGYAAEAASPVYI